MKIALATCERLPLLDAADRPLIEVFKKRKVEAVPVAWNDIDTNWNDFEAVIIRNTWDYYLQYQNFTNWLQSLHNQRISVYNPLELIFWNIHKFYLKGLSQKGIKIIPSFFVDREVQEVSLPWRQLVIKPAVSAGSFKTHKISREELELEDLKQAGEWLIQPFIPEIESNGEVSLIFIQGDFSHAVKKTPKEGDFKVQKQYGGNYQVYTPTELTLIQAENVLKSIPNHEKLLFARIDGIVIDEIFYLMEVELIEPDLYFNLVPEARDRFVDAFLNQKVISQT